MLKGSMVALVTPMSTEGTIDYGALKDLLDWHSVANTTALIIAGTTGESSALTRAEFTQLLSFCIEHCGDKLPIIAGTGTNNTVTTIEQTRLAQQLGAAAALIVTPYYNKPPQEGLYQHYAAIHEAIDLPLILYNVPGRTACDLLPQTIARLAQLPNIIGIKEATGDLNRVAQLAQLCGDNFALYSGDDASALDFIAAGGHGVISVTANIAPELMQAMCKAALDGNLAQATHLNRELELLHQRLFLQANPIPVKWALQQMGKIAGGIRLPLLPLASEYHLAVKEALHLAGVAA